MFINNGRHFHVQDYSRGNVPSKEVQIYTWMDATLKELTSLVKEVNESCRKPGSRFDFALVFPDMRAATYRIREIGSTVNGRKEPDDLKTLAQSRFQIGDYLDVAIYIPNSDLGPRGGGHYGGPPGPRGGGPRFNGDRDREFGGRDHRDRGRPY